MESGKVKTTTKVVLKLIQLLNNSKKTGTVDDGWYGYEKFSDDED